MILQLEKHIYEFLKELARFDYTLSATDRIWNFLFKNQANRWSYFHITRYRNVFYINHVDGNYGTLEVEPKKKSIKIMDDGAFSPSRSFYENEHLMGEWTDLIASARKWLKVVERNWIKANKQIQEEYPLNYRYGTVPHSLIRASLSDIYRLDKELGKTRSRKLSRLIEDGFFMKDENTIAESMTAAKYFEYCKFAYIAGQRGDDKVDKSLSGGKMYRLYADGRHEGLLDIEPNSEQEFADWLDGKHPKRSGGGHPWEIKRGGNTTHIDLSVRRPSLSRKEGFVVELRGESLGRMAETLKMLLALHEASLPITITNPESVRQRLHGQDNIGIVPKYSSLHRANQHFPDEDDVFEVMYYDDLGRYKRRITPFIRWEALPILNLTI